MVEDLAMMMLDIGSNSLRANAKNIYILFKESLKDDTITLSIEDDGSGMDEEMLKKATSPFYTSRSTRKIGLGLALFKGLAQECDGNFELKSKINEGTSVSITVRRSHWDTPPRGDLAESIVILIQANSDINLDFIYKTDINDFHFSLNEIKETLEDVPINNPEILLWIKEYLRENLEAIQKEGGTYEITRRT